MKALRTLLLGSAGAAVLFVTASVAQAASPPGTEAYKGREPVWRCDTAGFIEYPGSDFCFKIGGKVAAWIGGADENGTDGEGLDPYGVRHNAHPTDDTFWMGTLARFNIDVRRASEFGIIRVFMEFEASDGNSSSSGSPGFRHGFIQVGNWLFGKTWSTFRSVAGTPELFTDPLGAPGDQATVRVVQVRYTFRIGNGVTVNVALEDPAFFNNDFDNSTNSTYDVDAILPSRNEAPDFVANIQVSGTWGKAQASVAVHQHSATGFGGSNDNRRPIGWATLLGVALNVPGTMGDVIYVEGSYADGHMGAIDTGANFSIADVGAATLKVSGWAVVGGWEHYWSQSLRSTFAGSYVRNNEGAEHSIDIRDATSAWVNLIWTAAPKLDLGVEVIWVRNRYRTSAADTFATGNAVAVAAEAVQAF